jgi:acyl-CoA thioesterase
MSEVPASPPGLSATMGLEKIVDDGAASGRAVLHYRARPDHCHSGGIVQGGFVTGWIDAAMAHVVIAKSQRELSPLSLEIKISFLQSAKPGLVIAEAWIERMGKSTAFLEGRLLNEAGDVLAKGTSTARLVPLPKGPLL